MLPPAAALYSSCQAAVGLDPLTGLQPSGVILQVGKQIA